MKIDPQKALRAIAAAGCVFLGSSAVLAQNDEGDDDQQRQDQSQERDRQQSQNQARQDSNRESRQSERRNSDNSARQGSRGSEPWENRSESQRRQSERNWNESDSASPQFSNSQTYGQQDSNQRGSRQQESNQAGLGISFSGENEEPVVRQVHSGSPAEEMGLRRGDRITRVNGEEVRTARDVIQEVQRSEPGDDIEIEVTRNGDERSFEGELESREEALVLRSNQRERRGLGSGYASQWDSNRSERRADRPRGGDFARGEYGSGEFASDDARSGYGRIGRDQQDAQRQLDSLERQVQQLHREIDELRRSLDGRSDSYGRSERQAGYSEYGNNRSDEVRTSYSYEGGQAPDDGFRGSSNRGSSYRDGYRGQESSQVNSPGGVVGGARTRPESDWIDNR